MPDAPLSLMPATQGVLIALRAACDALHAAPEEVTAISIVGRVRPGSTALPLLARAESLAKEFELSVVMGLSRGTFEVRFSRDEAPH